MNAQVKPKQIKKLSVATVWGKIDLKEVLNAEAPIHVMRAIGQAVNTKAGNSSYGDWTALQGQFRCTNPATGEIFDGATLFLPDVALIPVQLALSNGATTFAVDIFVNKSTNAKPGGSPYEYSFAHVLPPADTDPIKRLEAEIMQLALPAPVPQDGGSGDTQQPATSPAAPAAKTARR